MGYNHKDLLYAAIRENHVQITGRPLAPTPSFGGNSGLKIDWEKLNYGTISDTSKAAAAELSRTTIGMIVRTLGKGIFAESSQGIFVALFKIDGQKLRELAEFMGMRLSDDASLKKLVRAIETVFQDRHMHHSAPTGGAVQIMRDVDAAHRMHGVQQTAAVLLAEHYHSTRLTRKALQDKKLLGKERLDSTELSPGQMQNLINYLADDACLRDAITASVGQNIGGASSPRYWTLCLDPDAQIAAMINGESQIDYTGDEFEQAMGLLPLGYALAVAASNQFQESANRDTEATIDGFANLSFMDSKSRLIIGPAYERISKFMADTERNGTTYNTTRVFQYIARAMRDSIDAARDAGEWRALCKRTLAVNKEYPDSKASMPKGTLQETVRLIYTMMSSEANLSDLLARDLTVVKILPS